MTRDGCLLGWLVDWMDGCLTGIAGRWDSGVRHELGVGLLWVWGWSGLELMIRFCPYTLLLSLPLLLLFTCRLFFLSPLSLSSHLSFWLPGPVYPFDWHYFIINFRWQHLTHMQHRSNVRASLESLTTSKNTITYRKRDNDVSSATEIKFAPLTLSPLLSLSAFLSW